MRDFDIDLPVHFVHDSPITKEDYLKQAYNLPILPTYGPNPSVVRMPGLHKLETFIQLNSVQGIRRKDIYLYGGQRCQVLRVYRDNVLKAAFRWIAKAFGFKTWQRINQIKVGPL